MQTATNSTIETHGRAVRTRVNDRRKSLKAAAGRSGESAGMKLSLAIQQLRPSKLRPEGAGIYAETKSSGKTRPARGHTQKLPLWRFARQVYNSRAR